MHSYFTCIQIVSLYMYIVLLYNSVGITNTQLSYNKVKRTIARKKNKHYPKEPTIQEIQLEFMKPEVMAQYGFTLDGNARFYIETINEPEYQFTIFCSDFTKKFIQNNISVGLRKYLIDATFGKLPLGYYQLLIIAVNYKNDVS